MSSFCTKIVKSYLLRLKEKHLKMNSNFSRRCILCLRESYDKIQNLILDSVESKVDLTSLRNKFYMCLPELNLRIISKVVLCRNCLEAMNFVYSFKNGYSKNSNDSVKNYFEHCLYIKNEIKEERTDVDNQNDFINRNLECIQYNKLFVKNDYSNVCQTCWQIIYDGSEMLSLDFLEFDGNLNLICNQLYLCLPELDLRNTPKAVLCKRCVDAINIVYQFKNHYFEMEKQIDKHLQTAYLSSKFIEPVHVLEFKSSCYIGIINDVKIENFDVNETEERKTESISEILPVYNLIKTESKTNTVEMKSKQRENSLKYSDPSTFFYRCLQCTYSTQNQISLKNHALIHTTEHLFKCAHCEYNAIRKSSLKIHNHCHTLEKPYQCSQCNYCTKQKPHLRRHMLTHSNEKPFKCAHCSYSAIERATLRIHILSHTGVKPFQCLECEYAAKQKTNLKRHMLIHTNQKPFKCTYCDYSSREKASLRKHILRHTGQRPLKCAHCDYGAIDKSSLKMHILVHRGEKPFECSQCEYSTRQKSKLKRHMSIHTNEKLLTCSDCIFSSRYKSRFKKHLSLHKNE